MACDPRRCGLPSWCLHTDPCRTRVREGRWVGKRTSEDPGVPDSGLRYGRSRCRVCGEEHHTRIGACVPKTPFQKTSINSMEATTHVSGPDAPRRAGSDGHNHVPTRDCLSGACVIRSIFEETFARERPAACWGGSRRAEVSISGRRANGGSPRVSSVPATFRRWLQVATKQRVDGSKGHADTSRCEMVDWSALYPKLSGRSFTLIDDA
jgi:hypothetical protein